MQSPQAVAEKGSQHADISRWQPKVNFTADVSEVGFEPTKFLRTKQADYQAISRLNEAPGRRGASAVLAIRTFGVTMRLKLRSAARYVGYIPGEFLSLVP